ncbi:MAG: hypothetical protein IH819_09910, partial [Bacteroidetes bacterium]|nr:hypothetical protein [Bacteroidota bacterium]
MGSLADELGGSISTRLKNIDNVLKQRLRKYEFDVRQVTKKDQEVVNGFLRKVHGERDVKLLGKRRGGMTQEDFLDFDLASKNGDILRMDTLAKKYGFTGELTKIRTMLDDLYKRANDVGFDIGYLENYMPRTIDDAAGFI